MTTGNGKLLSLCLKEGGDHRSEAYKLHVILVIFTAAQHVRQSGFSCVWQQDFAPSRSLRFALDDAIDVCCKAVRMAAAMCPLCRQTVLCGPASSQLTKPPPPFAPRAIAWNKTRCSKQSHTAQRPIHPSHCLASPACDADTAQQPLRTGDEAVAPVWDVVGLGQPMVDFSASVDDDLLVRLGIVKGSRRYWVPLCVYVKASVSVETKASRVSAAAE